MPKDAKIKFSLDKSTYLKTKPPDLTNKPDIAKKPILKSPTLKKTTQSPSTSKPSPKGAVPKTIDTPPKKEKIVVKSNPLDPKLVNRFSKVPIPTNENKRKCPEKGLNTTTTVLPLPKNKKMQRITAVESSIDGSVESLTLPDDHMNQMWDNQSENEKNINQSVLKPSETENIAMEQDLPPRSTEIQSLSNVNSDSPSEKQGKFSDLNPIKKSATIEKNTPVNKNKDSENEKGVPKDSTQSKQANNEYHSDESALENIHPINCDDAEINSLTNENESETSSTGTVVEKAPELHIVIMEVEPTHKNILRCPIDVMELLAEVLTQDIKADIADMHTNYPRSMIILKVKTQPTKQSLLKMKKIGEINIIAREPKNENLNYGVIGPLPCPENEEEREIKLQKYKELLAETGTPVDNISWISKRENNGESWNIRITNFLRLHFIHNPPKDVRIGYKFFKVNDYIEEVVQCWNCQRFGHTSKNCIYTQRCVFCGTVGHRKRENKCRTRHPRCANCQERHPAWSKRCICYLKELEAKKIKGITKIPIHDAKKLADEKEYPDTFKQSNQKRNQSTTRNGISYAAATKPKKRPNLQPSYETEEETSENETVTETETETEVASEEETEAASKPKKTKRHKKSKTMIKVIEKIVNKAMKTLIKEILPQILIGMTQHLFPLQSAFLNSDEKTRVMTEKINNLIQNVTTDNETEASSDSEYESTNDLDETDPNSQETRKPDDQTNLTQTQPKEKGKWIPNPQRRRKKNGKKRP